MLLLPRGEDWSCSWFGIRELAHHKLVLAQLLLQPIFGWHTHQTISTFIAYIVMYQSSLKLISWVSQWIFTYLPLGLTSTWPKNLMGYKTSCLTTSQGLNFCLIFIWLYALVSREICVTVSYIQKRKDINQTSSQSSGTSSWPSLVIFCLNSPCLYLKPYPQAGKLSVAMESRKHEASLPRPPFPSAASFSCKVSCWRVQESVLIS